VVHRAEQIPRDRFANRADQVVLALDNDLLAWSSKNQIHTVVTLKLCGLNVVAKSSKLFANQRSEFLRCEADQQPVTLA
jgi:hypothetical protein